MSQTTASTTSMPNPYATGLLGKRTPWYVLIGVIVVVSIAFALIGAAGNSDFNIVGVVLVSALVYMAAIYVFSLLIEGTRKAKDRLVTALVVSAFAVAQIGRAHV